METQLSPSMIAFLGNQALAVSIALARRVGSIGCAEMIADILSYFGRNETLIRELDAQLMASTKDTEKRFRLHTVGRILM